MNAARQNKADSPKNGNSNGVPDWMIACGIKPGEYQYITKPQLRVMQRPYQPLKAQVWATGMLHSVGYQGELATKLVNGRRVAITQSDIAAELHRIAVRYYADGGIPTPDLEEHGAKLRWSKHDLRRVLVDLEQEGVAERKTKNGKPLRELAKTEAENLSGGQIRMFFYQRPKPADTKLVQSQWESVKAAAPDEPGPESEPDRGAFNAPLPPPIRLILKVFQIGPVEKGQISTPEYQNAVTAAYLEAKKVFLEKMNGFADQGGIECTPSADAIRTPQGGTTSTQSVIKGETTVERKVGSSSSSAVADTDHLKAEEEDSLSATSLYAEFKRTYPRTRFDEPRAKTAFQNLSIIEQRNCIKRLQVYLACDRWKDQDGRWIPLASNWLKSYDADPPPLIRRAGGSASENDVLEVMKAMKAGRGES